ncbi:MAG: response regulator transcription factor [Rhizobiales bacterium]|nr:response regulator transcription factor [Hyphomicrobiales bacterium]
MRIAIIEDNKNLAKGIAYRLQDRGHAIDILHDGASADDFLKSDGNDIIILDINLPGLDGLSVLRNLRARGDERPVLLLTAYDNTAQRVSGLDAGADDYLTKPFAMEELEARLRALGRRKGNVLRSFLRLDALAFDVSNRSVTYDDKPIEIPRRECALLEILLLRTGRMVPKLDLLEHLYGTGADVDVSAVEVHISRLRKKLVPFDIEIQMQRGLGYQLVKVGGK